ncbi:MAG: hypothetical protein K2Y18_02610 [Alphaproteobacteria bacterium]|jgi:hypothetical protein|nr:hypothetical protein [Alphaproteobacteria bacterium]
MVKSLLIKIKFLPGFSLGIFGFSLMLLFALGIHAYNLHHQIELLKHRLLTLTQSSLRSQEAEMLIKSYASDFEKFESCKFDHPITQEDLQKEIAHPITFGSVSSQDQESTNKNLVYQEVSISIPCLQDTNVFTLLEQLMEKGPGLFQIHTVTIHRVSSLNEEMLEKIASGKPQALFDGKITATWIHR